MANAELQALLKAGDELARVAQLVSPSNDEMARVRNGWWRARREIDNRARAEAWVEAVEKELEKP